MTWTEKDLRSLHAEHLAGAMISPLAKRRRKSTPDLVSAWAAIGLAPRPRLKYSVPSRRVPEATVMALHGAYMAGESLSSIGRRIGRSPTSLRGLFETRRLVLKPTPNSGKTRRPNGTFHDYIPATEERIRAIIAAADCIAIPMEIAIDWRHWDMTRRASFIAALRARLADPRDRPDTPFSSNVIPFQYGTPEAHRIAAEMNAGLPSKLWKTKLDLRSQGVIWNGKLWFWNRSGSIYIEGTKWVPGKGRKVLEHAIWCHHHGVPVPRGSVVRHRDGNRNNLDPSNLYLSTRNEVIRETQSRHLSAKSRARTAAILNLHQTALHGPDHHLLSQISDRRH